MAALRTLLVDDSPAFRDAVVRFFAATSEARSPEAEPAVNVVGHAGSGQEALDQVLRLQPDLVLMDWMMPGMDGLEATRCLKAHLDSPRIIMLTAHEGSHYCEAALAAGADGFVLKQEFATQLLPMIEDWRR
jgi:DNA-binding NarL/FixJ family response regulator